MLTDDARISSNRWETINKQPKRRGTIKKIPSVAQTANHDLKTLNGDLIFQLAPACFLIASSTCFSRQQEQDSGQNCIAPVMI